MGIKIYKKSIYDLDNISPITTITDSVAMSTGQDFVNLLRNRDDESGWGTTGSNDSGNTTLEIDFVDLREFDRIMLLSHNFKSFTIKYWNGSSWVDFSTPINETTNTNTSNYFIFNKIFAQKIQLIINGTQTPNDDKFLRQLIVTEAIGEFTAQPYAEPTIDRDRQTTKYLSGKSYVSKSAGGFLCNLRLNSMEYDADQQLAEKLYDSYEGFLVSLSGGYTNDLETVRFGWRPEDIFLMQVTNEYSPEWKDGRFNNGLPLNLKLAEIN